MLASCYREGSLDSEIDDASVLANDFVKFFREHSLIRSVYFNGTKAEASFHKWVRPVLTTSGFTFQRLPSTSPANASYSLEKKRLAWEIILK